MNGGAHPVEGTVVGGALLRSVTVSAGLILGLTALAKLWTAFGDVRLLTVADPIVGISFKHLMLTVGVMELAIAAVCSEHMRAIRFAGRISR